MSATRQKNILPKLKIHLLEGKSITHAQAWELWHTNRLSEYIRRCRVNFGMKVKTEMVTSREGDIFGKYYLELPKKESRISNQMYK